MEIQVEPYDKSREKEWDSWCDSAVNGHFLSSRKFLNYHKDRFEDVSVFLREQGELIAIFPAALTKDEPKTVVSHPGATYGGLIHNGKLNGAKMLAAMECLKAFYKNRSLQKLIYKVQPYIYSKSPNQDDLYALFRCGALRSRCDLSNAIDLKNRREVSERRKRSLKKAMKAVTVSQGHQYLPSLWQVIESNLSREHGAKAVHSFEEIKLLGTLFPDNIRIAVGLINNSVEAGVILFNSQTVWHSQYIASSSAGYEVSALDAVFNHLITEASAKGARYFDFGTSNERSGLVLNEGLYQFKSEFGGGGVAHEFYEMDLR